MTRRQTLKAIEQANPGIKVRYNSDLGEYVVRMLDSKADEGYFTDDLDDAAGTARLMFNARYVRS